MEIVRRMRMAALLTLVVFQTSILVSCGDREENSSTPATPVPAAPEREAPAEPTLLDESGELSDADPSDGRGRYDRFYVPVQANERLVVTLTSESFDPILEVTPPGNGMLVNDDFQGDRTRSQIELIVAQSGQMKVEVRAYQPEGQGTYHVRMRRANEAQDAEALAASSRVLSAGDVIEGELDASDGVLEDGTRFDDYVIRSMGAVRVSVSGEGDGAMPRVTLVDPRGWTLEAVSNGTYEAPRAGNYRLQVMGASPGQTMPYRIAVSEMSSAGAPAVDRAHHQIGRVIRRLQGVMGAEEQAARSRGSAAANPSGASASPGAPAAAPTVRNRTPLPLRIGDRLNGNLAASDPSLPSGEHYDVYLLNVTEPHEPVWIEMESSDLDCFLRVDGPQGQHWENDDSGGTLNSRVQVMLAQPGEYRVTTTSYRPGETGPYQLKVLSARHAVVTASAGTGESQAGRLETSDRRLHSGEFVDDYTFEWSAGTHVHLEARSTEFDTYLIVRSPSGQQRDNDDMNPGQSLNAGLDLQITEEGTWRVMLTSYRPGETGAYTLVTQGGDQGASSTNAPASPSSPQPSTNTPGANPAVTTGSQTQRGTLAAGDRRLQSGEFVDSYTMTFTPRSAVQIRLNSEDFDTYLIVRTPSGRQQDNDDFTPGNLNSGFDIQVAEPGEYRVMVTSYRSGETGAYELQVSEGPSVVAPVPAPSDTPGTPGAPASRGGHVWGLFAGITDYPGGTSDLPECANDAVKLAEAVRRQGVMPSEQEFLFTDGQATLTNIRQAMAQIASRIQPNDVFVFFFSGHGGQTQSSTDTRELDRRDEYLVLYDGRLMDDELGRLFDAINGRVSLVTVDACFAGGFAKDIITRPGRVGMFSSEEDVTSSVAGRFQAGGYLSHFLRLGIGGEADNDPHNQVLTVGELTHYTWRQFGQHASDVRMSMGYQHLVVDRGAVQTSEVLWAPQR